MLANSRNQPNLDNKTLHYKKSAKTTSSTFLETKNKNKI